jgi:hypothetical protein
MISFGLCAALLGLSSILVALAALHWTRRASGLMAGVAVLGLVQLAVVRRRHVGTSPVHDDSLPDAAGSGVAFLARSNRSMKHDDPGKPKRLLCCWITDPNRLVAAVYM